MFRNVDFFSFDVELFSKCFRRSEKFSPAPEVKGAMLMLFIKFHSDSLPRGLLK